MSEEFSFGSCNIFKTYLPCRYHNLFTYLGSIRFITCLDAGPRPHSRIISSNNCAYPLQNILLVSFKYII
ncbi:hypothetical protein HanXRQr2_Chr09g0382891 [Helianthus annuus]|uniref:Uncharacterized protein n=1 Tax=Helianthus annuus TaxID=4232 RepID=A0A9K3I520_HELAN|nr:hypothetical protein HanXRQr2_Chr09g0382891 [Helianthus annuus]KAJ0892691.1 hypothetical protein HanPSC8_Chr09g0368951 [Helianthus annuus]